MNENKDKISEKSKAQSPIKSNKPVSNPLSKQLNALKKPALKTPDKIATKKEVKRISNPISAETSDIVARINNFNTNKTSNRMYAGYMGNANASSHRVIDYAELVNNLNNTLCKKKTIYDLFSAIHNLFIEKFNNVFSAFGAYHDKSKCINIKLFNSMGSTYTSKLFLSDDQNPVIQCFKNSSPVVCENSKFLNIPYVQQSPTLILPLVSVSGCKGVMAIGKDNIENHIGLFSFIANYCALFMDNVELLEQTNKYANTDTLTGLYTHRGFQEVLSAELRRAEENNSL